MGISTVNKCIKKTLYKTGFKKFFGNVTRKNKNDVTNEKNASDTGNTVISVMHILESCN